MTSPRRKTVSRAAPRAWQRMLSGRRLDLLDPSPLDIEIEDIAHGLSRVARWNGQTEGANPFTVAQHSLLVTDIAIAMKPALPARWKLAALLHDAPEYVVGDLISPFKAAVGLDYKAFENRLLGAIHMRFGLPAVLPESVTSLIKRADRAAAFFEAVDLAGFEQAEAARIFTRPRRARPYALTPMAHGEVKRTYLRRFHALAQEAGMPEANPFGH
jgi:5'-deoxynucleotidase YfbR-like HD superfamily hydrolase